VAALADGELGAQYRSQHGPVIRTNPEREAAPGAVDSSLPAGELVFQMIGAVAQFERSLIAERVKSGLANARADGKVLGRLPLRKLTRVEVAELRRQRTQRGVPFRHLARKFGVSVWTAHRMCARG